MKNFVLFTLLNLIMAFGSLGQQNYDPDASYAVTKNDGTTYIGKILSDDGREVLMMTESLGKIYIPKSDIRSIKKIEPNDLKRGVYVGENVFTTRYQFTTNAFPIKKGENYAVLNLYGPEVHFSLADNFSVGVMSTWIGSPIALALKYTIPTKDPKLNFGFGTLIGSSGYLNQAQGFGGLHWGMVSYGDRFNNVTASFGYAYFNNGSEGTDWLTAPGTYYSSNPMGGGFNFPMTLPFGTGTYKAPIVGLSGMFAVGERATFILDVMGLSASQERYYQTANFDGTEIWNSNVVTINEPTPYSARSNNLVVMPAMRFQRKDNRAVQFSLAGVIGQTTERNSSIYETNLGKEYKNTYSIPFPMVSWFFKF